MSSMKSNTAKDSEEATGAGAGAGDGASAGNVTVVNAPTATEPSEVVEGEGEGSAGTNNDNDNEREQSSSSSLHRNQVQHQHQQEQQGQGEEATDSVTSASARARTRPDAFQIYSDDDTRMLGLLGQDASANPNDAGVNWRQLVGLSAAEQERRRRDVNAENGDTPRRTRLSYELHPDVFYEMWFGPGGEFDLNDGAARNDVLAERRGQGGRQEQDQDDDNNEDLDNGGV